MHALLPHMAHIYLHQFVPKYSNSAKAILGVFRSFIKLQYWFITFTTNISQVHSFRFQSKTINIMVVLKFVYNNTLAKWAITDGCGFFVFFCFFFKYMWVA